MQYARGDFSHDALYHLLRLDHARLDSLFERLIDAFNADFHDEVAHLWARFAIGLRRHFVFEEMHILPHFKRVDPTAAAEHACEHAQIVTLLERISLRVELRFLREEVVDELTCTLRAHAKHNDEVLYAWLRSLERDATSAHWRSNAASALDALMAA